MGSYLIKPQLDVDLYVWWSTISDSPVMWGTKKDFLKKYKKRKWMFRFGEDFKNKLKLADETGFGTRFDPTHMCEDGVTPGIRVANATLPIANLPAYLKIYETDLSMNPDDAKLIWLAEQWEL